MQIDSHAKESSAGQYPALLLSPVVAQQPAVTNQAVYCVRCQVLYKHRLSLDGLNRFAYLMLERVGYSDSSLYKVSDKDFEWVQRHQIVDVCIYYDNHQPSASIIGGIGLTNTSAQIASEAKKRIRRIGADSCFLKS